MPNENTSFTILHECSYVLVGLLAKTDLSLLLIYRKQLSSATFFSHLWLVTGGIFVVTLHKEFHWLDLLGIKMNNCHDVSLPVYPWARLNRTREEKLGSGDT